VQQHLHIPASGLNFVSLPTDATELMSIMDEFHHELEVEEKELHNGWGGIVITDEQASLKRVDLFIFWNEVEMERGFPVLDANGEPILALGADGNPILRISSQRVYIHEDSQYFNAPGA